MKQKQILIADTTLRDGAQTIGVHFNVDAKLQIAKQLVKLGIDVIEIGTPIASQHEFDTGREAAKALAKSDVCLSAFARSKDIDIEKAWESIGKHPNAMLALLTSVSDIHLDSKFKKGRKEMLNYFCDKIVYAKSLGFKKILVYLEDGTRTDFEYVHELVSSFIDAGGTTISIPDTVGFVNDPEMYGCIYSKLKESIKIPKNVLLSAHTHNDKGLAVANALAAIRHGADQVECTINGLGERAGNASLAALLLNFYSPDGGKWFSSDYKVKTNINLKEYAKTAQMVGDLGGLGINYNEPLMGSAVYTTAAGIHQDGIIKNKNTYFCLDPEIFGISTENKLLSFNMLSGVKGIIKALDDMGLKYEKDVYEKIYEQVIVLAQQKSPSLEDIKAIALDVSSDADAFIDLEICKVASGVLPCSAEVVLKNNKTNKNLRGIGYGDGPFAAFMDITCDLLDLDAKILDYHDTVVGTGRDSQMQCFIECRIGQEIYHGRGVSTDIVLAGCRAFMKCINRALLEEEAPNEDDKKKSKGQRA